MASPMTNTMAWSAMVPGLVRKKKASVTWKSEMDVRIVRADISAMTTSARPGPSWWCALFDRGLFASLRFRVGALCSGGSRGVEVVGFGTKVGFLMGRGWNAVAG